MAVSVKALPRQNGAIGKTVKIETAKAADKPAAPSLAERLLLLETQLLDCPDRLALQHQIVNAARALLPLGHVFLVLQKGRRFKIQAVSSQADISKDAPFIQWLQRQLAQRVPATGSAAFSLTAPLQSSKNPAPETFDYPFEQAFWSPFDAQSTGGLLFTRERVFTEREHTLMDRLGKVTGLKWQALGRKRLPRLTAKRRFILGGVLAAILLAGLIPVSVTTLAPAEVVAAKPVLVTAPMDGVIKSLTVLPGTPVKKGDIIGYLDDTDIRGEYELAAREAEVAEARLRQAGLTAFVDDPSKREIALAQAELELARTSRDYAKARLDKTALRAQSDGIALYSDPKDFIGRPVQTGETLIEIADPNRIELRLEAPVMDAAMLEDSARVRLYLDGDPLRPVDARLTRLSYYASVSEDQRLAYIAYADLSGSAEAARLGARGVAKIYGQKAPLGYWILRRPITALRQMIGL